MYAQHRHTIMHELSCVWFKSVEGILNFRELTKPPNSNFKLSHSGLDQGNGWSNVKWLWQWRYPSCPASTASFARWILLLHTVYCHWICRIEHLDPPVLEEVPGSLFGVLQPRVVVVTTPNAEFNVLFPGFSGFRHHDHRFEWTRVQFQAWYVSNNWCRQFLYGTFQVCRKSWIILSLDLQKPAVPKFGEIFFLITYKSLVVYNMWVDLRKGVTLRIVQNFNFKWK